LGTFSAFRRILLQPANSGNQSSLMEDYDIILRVKRGDIEAYSHLVEKYHKHLLNFIFLLVGDEKVVEDIGQEVFLNVYRSLSHFDEQRGTPFSAWLFITARNRCTSEIRKRRNRSFISLEEAAEIPGPDRSPIEMLIKQEHQQALEEALEKLPEPYRRSILKNLQGLTPETIAVQEGISLGTVKSRLFRARQRIKRLLANISEG
jgi:RNA polymerase sigma-70 factor, ECF subfamily